LQAIVIGARSDVQSARQRGNGRGIAMMLVFSWRSGYGTRLFSIKSIA
jgi:hypothetical protein